MNRVFMDTVGLLALWNVDDQWHAAAEDAFAKVDQAQMTLVTTAYVLLECGLDRLPPSGRRLRGDRGSHFVRCNAQVWQRAGFHE